MRDTSPRRVAVESSEYSITSWLNAPVSMLTVPRRSFSRGKKASSQSFCTPRRSHLEGSSVVDVRQIAPLPQNDIENPPHRQRSAEPVVIPTVVTRSVDILGLISPGNSLDAWKHCRCRGRTA